MDIGVKDLTPWRRQRQHDCQRKRTDVEKKKEAGNNAWISNVCWVDCHDSLKPRHMITQWSWSTCACTQIFTYPGCLTVNCRYFPEIANQKAYQHCCTPISPEILTKCLSFFRLKLLQAKYEGHPRRWSYWSNEFQIASDFEEWWEDEGNIANNTESTSIDGGLIACQQGITHMRIGSQIGIEMEQRKSWKKCSYGY